MVHESDLSDAKLWEFQGQAYFQMQNYERAKGLWGKPLP